MTNQFKKFLVFLVSGGLAVVPVYFFTRVYQSSMNGNSFGGELILIIPPVFILSILSFYYMFVGKFIKTDNNLSVTAQSKFRGMTLIIIVEWITISFFLSGLYFSWSSVLLVLLVWVAIIGTILRVLENSKLNKIFFWIGLVVILYLVYGRVLWF